METINKDAFLAFMQATDNDIYDPEWQGGSWLDEVEWTYQTLDQLAQEAKTWQERRHPEYGYIANVKFVTYPMVQIKKGDTRAPFSVVDFGDIRMIIRSDLTFYDYTKEGQ